MWDVLLIIFLVIFSILGAIWVFVIYKRRQKAIKEGNWSIEDIITRNSGYCEQSTKNFTTVPFRVSVVSSSSRSSKSSTLIAQEKKSTDSAGDKDERVLAIRRKSDLSWKGNSLDEETKQDMQKYNDKTWT